MLLAALVTGVAALSAGEALLLVVALGSVAALALAAGLWRERAVAVPWALLALGAAVAFSLAEDGDPGRAPLYAGGLLAVAELAYWSLETRLGRPAVPGLAARRLALVSGLVAGSVAVGSVLVGVSRIEPGGGLVLEAGGVAAVVAAVTLVFALSRRAG